jgi:hypothetical protein
MAKKTEVLSFDGKFYKVELEDGEMIDNPEEFFADKEEISQEEAVEFYNENN